MLEKINAVPSTAFVLKNAIFFVSRGFSLVNSGLRDCGSDSPVNEELSTLNPLALTTRISAGTRSPNFTSIKSPATKSLAIIVLFSPSRMTTASWGIRFLNESMMRELLASWKQEKQPVRITTTARTMPKYKLSLGASSQFRTVIVYAKKQRIAPIHKSMAKPPNRLRQNLTHSGVVFGGDNSFGPSLAKTV